MCSGCSGDYYSDFRGHDGIPDESFERGLGSMRESHCGNWEEQSQEDSDFTLAMEGSRGFPRHEAPEECEIFVSETRITEVRVLRADKSVCMNGNSPGGGWKETARVRQRLPAATAKHYRTFTGAKLLFLSDRGALPFAFASFCFGFLVAALLGMLIVVR